MFVKNTHELVRVPEIVPKDLRGHKKAIQFRAAAQRFCAHLNYRDQGVGAHGKKKGFVQNNEKIPGLGRRGLTGTLQNTPEK